MSKEEQGAISRSLHVFDLELEALGETPLRSNPSFREGTPLVGVFPNFYLEKAGAPPFQFIFGSTFEVWVGPFSEVVLAEASIDAMGELGEVIRRTLCSEVSIRVRRSWTTITLKLPDSRPWRRLKVWSSADSSVLLPHYDSFASGDCRQN